MGCIIQKPVTPITEQCVDPNTNTSIIKINLEISKYCMFTDFTTHETILLHVDVSTTIGILKTTVRSMFETTKKQLKFLDSLNDEKPLTYYYDTTKTIDLNLELLSYGTKISSSCSPNIRNGLNIECKCQNEQCETFSMSFFSHVKDTNGTEFPNFDLINYKPECFLCGQLLKIIHCIFFHCSWRTISERSENIRERPWNWCGNSEQFDMPCDIESYKHICIGISPFNFEKSEIDAIYRSSYCFYDGI